MLQYYGRKCLMIITSLTWFGKRRKRQEEEQKEDGEFCFTPSCAVPFLWTQSLIQVSGFKELSGTNAAVLSEAMSHKLWHLWFGLERRKRQDRRAREDTDFWADWLHLQSKLWLAKGREQRCIALNPQFLGILFGVTWQQISPSDLQGRQIWVDYLNSHLGWHAKQPLGWWQASF